MKPIYWLPLSGILMLMGGAIMAQEAPKAYGYPAGADDPVKIAAGQAKMSQSDLLKRQAKDALKKGETPRAIKLLEQAVTVFPDPESSILLADIYAKTEKTNDVIRVLKPMIYSPPNMGIYIAHLPTTRMKYVLALLDKYEWAEAAAVYEESFSGEQVAVYGQSKSGDLKWSLPDYHGTTHTLPDVHFRQDNPDYAGLRAQAHLILGALEPVFLEFKDEPKYMLEHLQQALKNNPKSLDALFISGHLLTVMERFDEARAMYQRTAKFAPKETKAEIDAALKDLKFREERKKASEIPQSAQAEKKSSSPENP